MLMGESGCRHTCWRWLMGAVAGLSLPAVACGPVSGASLGPDVPVILGALLAALMTGAAVLGLVVALNWLWRRRISPMVWPLSAGVLALMLGVAGSWGVPQFAKVFESFGVDLPMHTQLLLRGYPLLWLPLVLQPLLWHFWQGRVDRPRFFAPVWLAEVFILFTVLWALYAPIFTLGCAS